MLTLIIIARILCPYFDAHQIIVLTYLSLQYVLESHDASSQMMKYAPKLSRNGVQFQPKVA